MTAPLRFVCPQVLTRWREAAAVQIYRRQRADCALREAQRVLARGKRALELREGCEGPRTLVALQSCLLMCGFPVAEVIALQMLAVQPGPVLGAPISPSVKWGQCSLRLGVP